MDLRNIERKLENHKLFKDLLSSLKNENGEILRNLMELRDEVLFVWNAEQICLMTLNLKLLDEQDENIPYQKLHLLHPPSFDVERLLVGACGTRMCIWGPRGAVIMELPSRWGRGGLFDGGKDTVLCKSHALDERFLYSQGDVRRVHWHPTSLSHVLVLVSDNTIRVYNIALKSGPKLVKILNIGPRPMGLLSGKKLLDTLGDTAVDFSPIPDTNSLLILRGDGTVYMIQCDLASKSPLPPKLSGPLTMYPPADDNYGEESCSICVIDGVSKPPVVVIATCSAVLYHCMLLPDTQGDVSALEEESPRRDVESYALFVMEAVELNIMMTPDGKPVQNSYPVHLYPCSSNIGSYSCVHAAGVHAVTLPIVAQLTEYCMADEDECDNVLSTLCNKQSIVRYVVSTVGPKIRAAPPLGLAISPPHTLYVLCGDATILTRTVEPFDLEEQLYKELQMRIPSLEEDEISNMLKERQKLTFSSIIQDILTRDVSQPILNIKKDEEPTPKESLEFLTQATLKLRQEYISRQERAAELIRRKINNLKTLQKQQIEWYNDLQKDINDVHKRSAVVLEKWSLAEKHQEDLKYRCSSVIRSVRANAAATPAEREVLTELEKYQLTSQNVREQIQRLQERAHRKNDEFLKRQEDYRKKDIALGKSHSETISSILQQQTAQISTLIEETKLLKDQLSIV